MKIQNDNGYSAEINKYDDAVEFFVENLMYASTAYFTPTEARAIAAELIRLANEIEAGK